MPSAAPQLRIGTAGWAIPASCRTAFAEGASILHRYRSRLDAVEINSSFYRPHQRRTYERWAASAGADFRFAVKAPKSITHERRLADCQEQVARFALETEGLGASLGVVLVQLPPSLMFDRTVAPGFFRMLRDHMAARIACEPRHRTWFSDDAGECLQRLGIARVAADPAVVPEAAAPGGSTNIAYFRLHGAPKIYDSAYTDTALSAYAAMVATSVKDGCETWCIFDNTMHGHATANALRLKALVTSKAGDVRRDGEN